MSLLTKDHKKVLREASRETVEDSFRVLSKYFKDERWLKKSNRYLKNTIEKLKKDNKASTIADKDLCSYISASAPIHCADGWSYLGRTLDALSQGDKSSASHLAYYAELRAAMALLACEGIGIFSQDHYVISSGMKCKRVPIKNCGTHRFAWPALEYWAQRTSARELLSDIVSPGSAKLNEWLKAASFGSADGYMADGWFKSWGLDLKRFSDDRDDRNDASYRPTNFTPRKDADLGPTLKFINELWTLCEPSAPSRFESLDRYLLRSSLERAFKGVHGKEAAAAPKDFSLILEKVVSTLSPAGLSSDAWKSFLSRKDKKEDPLLLTYASKTDGIDSGDYALQVTARATLLLRVATGACSRLIKNSGINWSDLEFWWHSVGEQKGLWSPGGSPTDTSDLWADIDNAINLFNDQTTGGTAISCAEWRRKSHDIISLFGECDRIALWGLKP